MFDDLSPGKQSIINRLIILPSKMCRAYIWRTHTYIYLCLNEDNSFNYKIIVASLVRR